MSNSQPIVGSKIKGIRESKNLSVEEIAERSGLSVEQILSVENDHTLPSLGPLIKIARALGVRLGTFLDDSDELGPVVCRAADRDSSISFSNGTADSRKHMEYHSLAREKAGRHMEPFLIEIQPSEANVRLAEGWGAAATVMAYGEVYTALQNHVIDAAMNPEMALISVKHGEVAPYYSRTEHQIFTDMLVANVDFLNDLSEKEYPVFQEAFRIATAKECEEWDRQIENCIVQAKEMGVEFIEVDKAPFAEMQVPVREGLLRDNPVLAPLYQIVQRIQEEK